MVVVVVWGRCGYGDGGSVVVVMVVVWLWLR